MAVQPYLGSVKALVSQETGLPIQSITNETAIGKWGDKLTRACRVRFDRIVALSSFATFGELLAQLGL